MSVEFYKKPLFWLIAGVPVILVLLVVFVILMAEDISEIYGTGEFPYAQMDFSQTIKVKTGNSYSNVDMDDYVAGVLPAEVGEFSSSKDNNSTFFFNSSFSFFNCSKLLFKGL